MATISKDIKTTYKTTSNAIRTSIGQNEDLGSQVINASFQGAELGSKAIKTSQIATEVATGTIHVTKRTINTGARNLKPNADSSIKTVVASKQIAPKVKTLSKHGVKTIGYGFGGVENISLLGADTLSGSEDLALEGTASAIKTAEAAKGMAEVGIKTGLGASKVVGRSGIKTVKTAQKAKMTFWQSYVKSNSIRQAMKSVGKAGAKSLAANVKAAGGSVVNAVITMAKGSMKKIVVPLLLIIVVACGSFDIIAAPVTAVGSIFSGVFSIVSGDGSTEEFEVEDYLKSAIPPMTAASRQNLADEIASQLKANGGDYDIVRLKGADGQSVVSPDLVGVTQAFYSDDEVVQMLEPIFNVKLLQDYDLSPTEDQASACLQELYDELFSITSESSKEHCGQDLLTGEGEAVAKCKETDKRHAIMSGDNKCPNHSNGHHKEYTDSHCDTEYWTCNGHKGALICGNTKHKHTDWTDAEHPGCYSTTYDTNDIVVEGMIGMADGISGMSKACSNCEYHFYCKGYHNCKGHKVITYSISLDGLYNVLNINFYQPIETIENVPEAERTKEQKKILSNLYENLELYETMASEVFDGSYGGGVTMKDLSKIKFLDSTDGRTGNQDLVDLALTQVGQKGGKPYWSLLGFDKRVEWCACFVNWCMRNTPSADSYYPTQKETKNNAYCQTLADYFSSHDKYSVGLDASATAPGDVIFFDWEGDGHTDHIGIVIGHDKKKIYTVEGNSGDSVKIKNYDLNSSVIYKFVYMKWQ